MFITPAKKLLWIILTVWCSVAHSQERIHFQVSKPYCLLNFMQTASGAIATSPSLKKYIDSALFNTDSSFRALVKEYTGIRLNYNFRRDEIPQSRHPNRSTYDIICNAAVKSAGLKDFRERISGLLPNTSLYKLIGVLGKAEQMYDRIIWNREYDKLLQQSQKLASYSAQVSGLFQQLSVFYGTGWEADYPFVVALYPIPGRNVVSTATPHGNSLCIGVPTEETDHERRMGVIMHEICHVLYDEQPAAMQRKLDQYLSGIQSPWQPLEGYYLDEALATVCGNSWAKSILSGKQDTGQWYNDIYINGFAHGLNTLVASYINEGKRMDSSLISSSVKIFEDIFPKAIYDYNILLNKMTVYSDAEDERERRSVNGILGKYFRISSSTLSSPVLHEFSLQELKAGKTTQLIIVDREHEKTIHELAKVLPELEQAAGQAKDENYVLSFYDQQKRPVILLRIKDSTFLEKAAAFLKSTQFLSPEKPYRPINE